jgi:CRP-like cAMP-binding protein
MDSIVDKSALLNRHEFFRDMPASAIARFTAHARVLAFASGQRIFSKGDDGFGLLAVISGMVRISVQSDGATELTLNLIGPNEVFGEIALLDGQPRTADATAMTACRVLLLERRDFLSTLMAEPSAALTLLKVVGGRLRRTSQQLEQASFGPMSSRLAQAVLSLGKVASPSGAPPALIRMSQRQIGNLIGLSRESTNRYLRAWQRAGVIDLHQGGFSILDRNALAKLAAE